MLRGKKIIVGISGGIAAYKVCGLVRMFVKNGAEVRVIMTPSAVKFVSPVTLSVLSGNEVAVNMFPEGDDYSVSEKIDTKTWHVNLGMWADVMLVAPATANFIAKAATGICDNFLLAAFLAAKCPVLIAPSMDDDMYKSRITKGNIQKLASLGCGIIDPSFGELASGIKGEGRLAEPEIIFEHVRNFLNKKRDLSGKKILITAGPTVEYIDSVRFISNASSGKMGFETARAALERGADVTLISGPVSLADIPGVKRINVKTTDEMFRSVKANIRGKDLVIMTAAVEDFTPAKKSASKIKKEGEDKFVFEFKKTTDILHHLGKMKKGYKLIGFALETDNGIENAKRKLLHKNLDLIVLNNPGTQGAGFGSDTNVVTLIDKKNKEELPLMSKFEVGNRILDRYLKMKS